MTVKWSPHAQELLGTILDDIAWNLYPEDAERWNGKIIETTMRLADYPELGAQMPISAFAFIPENPAQLRQLIISPYRAVYERVDDEIHILSIRHCRAASCDRFAARPSASGNLTASPQVHLRSPLSIRRLHHQRGTVHARRGKVA